MKLYDYNKIKENLKNIFLHKIILIKTNFI